MSIFDFWSLIIDNLARRKARVALTAVGVIIGTASVILLVSLGIGLQRDATERLGGGSNLTLIQVWPNWEGPPNPDGSITPVEAADRRHHRARSCLCPALPPSCPGMAFAAGASSRPGGSRAAAA
jgi:hypothetical protein